MRLNIFSRTIIDIAGLNVTNVMIRVVGTKKECVIVFSVKPSWKRLRCSKCGEKRPCFDDRKAPVQWVHLSVGSIRFILEKPVLKNLKKQRDSQ